MEQRPTILIFGEIVSSSAVSYFFLSLSFPASPTGATPEAEDPVAPRANQWFHV
jgi:hypothetical protein